jgi:hypothetical protein
LASIVEFCLQEGTAILPNIEIRQRECRGPECRVVFYICRSCDRGQCYCSEYCRRRSRLAQRSKANRKYQASRAARFDHADRQRAYIELQKQQFEKMTGQGIEEAGVSVTIDSSLINTGIAVEKAGQQAQQEACHAKPYFSKASRQTSSRLVFCIVCGRSALLPATRLWSP